MGVEFVWISRRLMASVLISEADRKRYFWRGQERGWISDLENRISLIDARTKAEH